MKEIKRRLMQNYVELMDGTFAKEVNGELIPVHEDEASAFEPEMFLDEADVDSWLHSRIDRVDKHKECLYFKEAKVANHHHRVEEYSGDEYISTRWSCGCYYYEEHERCPGCQSHETYYDCGGCRMRQKVIQRMSDEELTKYIEELAQNGEDDNPFYMVAMDEWKNRHEKN